MFYTTIRAMSEVTAMFLAGEIDAEDFNIEILRIAAVGN